MLGIRVHTLMTSLDPPPGRQSSQTEGKAVVIDDVSGGEGRSARSSEGGHSGTGKAASNHSSHMRMHVQRAVSKDMSHVSPGVVRSAAHVRPSLRNRPGLQSVSMDGREPSEDMIARWEAYVLHEYGQGCVYCKIHKY